LALKIIIDQCDWYFDNSLEEQGIVAANLVEITSIGVSWVAKANIIITLVSINHFISCFMEIEVIFVD
jgi:hypothetical protein